MTVGQLLSALSEYPTEMELAIVTTTYMDNSITLEPVDDVKRLFVYAQLKYQKPK